MRAKPYTRHRSEPGPTWVRSVQQDELRVSVERMTPPVSDDEQVTDAMERRGARSTAPEDAPVRRRREVLHSPPHVGHTRGIHHPDLDSQPVAAPPPRLSSLGRFQPLAGDSLPPILDEDEGPAIVLPPPPPSLASPLVQPDLSLDDQSTNLFDSLSMEFELQDDPGVTAVSHRVVFEASAADEEETRKPWQAAPASASSVVQSVADAIEHEQQATRAMPPVREPRPQTDEVVDWPPPRLRPTLDYPPGWDPQDMGDTRIVVDPTRPPAPRSRVVVLAIDAAAWLLGFAAMFLTGLVTTGSAALVLFAISLKN
jgi:hypothetical protein